MAPHQFVAVIDPAVRIAEVDCFNRLALASPLPLTYHLPVLGGTASLRRATDAAGIVILGSSSSVHDDLPWQRTLEDWLMDQMEKGTPTLGLCYGHQLLAHLHGGEIGFRTATQAKRLGFDDVELEPEPLWGGAMRGKLFFSHKEAVLTLPTSMRAVGRSRESALEALVHVSRPVWGFQAHLEATAEFAGNCGYVTEPAESTEDRDFAFGHSIMDAFLKFVSAKA